MMQAVSFMPDSEKMAVTDDKTADWCGSAMTSDRDKEMKKYNNILIKSIKVIVFCIGLFFIVNVINNIFMRKDAESKYKEFYDEAEEYDVLFAGISHMQVGVSPMELWKDYGITSFNLAESGTQIPYSYWVIKNALQYCSPKLVVVDVRRTETTDLENSRLLHVQFDKMPFGKVKLEAIRDIYADSLDKRIEMLFPLTIYHSRWTELSENDFTSASYRLDKGAYHYGDGMTVMEPAEYEILPETEKKKGLEVPVGYLKKIIELCQEQGIEVLLVNIPYLATDETQLYENGIADIAEEYGIQYINFLHVDGVVNYNTDLHNAGHLNDSGMKKVTEYMGDYIRKHYDIPDRRADEAYAGWDEDYVAFTDYKFDMMNSQSKTDSCLILLADKKVSSCIYIKKDSELLQDERYREILQNLVFGKKLKKLELAAEKGTDYLLIIDRNADVFYEYTEIKEDKCVECSFGKVFFGMDEEGFPFLEIENGETDDYLWKMEEEQENDAADSDIRIAAIDAMTGFVRSVRQF